MEQATRNRLRNIVTQCRRLLEETVAQTLQGQFGIYSGKKDTVHIEDESRMSHLSEQDRSCRHDLIDHLEHIKALGYKPSEALEQLVREIAFTHLNRLCAYKMMEARGLLREAVSRGLKSQGFFFYLADHPDDEKLHKGGQQDAAYRHFLDWLGGTLSEEIGVLFNPNDPANRIYPPQRVLDDVLALINDEELKDIWSQDEAIGWVYQYFTPKELRDKARKESQAPRNSYELAFRNQFYTPRYVVEFLTDNTLGRVWYEMRKGETSLKERCRYLVRRPTEIFLKNGEEPPAEAKETREDLSQEELLKRPVYIPHRPKKDPREIRVLDPACGSGHFLLYCFDLLQAIYEEAYEDPDLGVALKKDYPSIDDLRQAMPGLILNYNLHGIDIDLRATQIAALALWLRCQRAYQELGLNNGRPKITRANIVCAEPMPGESDFLKEFTATLQPRVLGQLVHVVFEKMRLAGEAGSLLKIEEEIKDAIAEAKMQWQSSPKAEQQELFAEMRKPKAVQGQLFDVSGITDELFWEQAEDRIVAALKEYAKQAENGHGFRRRLFAEDTSHGFAFIDLCRERYDVVLMNPPFGLAPRRIFEIHRKIYANSYVELYAQMVTRGVNLLTANGRLGAISSRSFMMISRLREYRQEIVLPRIDVLTDLGSSVMDEAFVESAAYVLSNIVGTKIIAIDLRDIEEPRAILAESILKVRSDGQYKEKRKWILGDRKLIRSLPDGKLLYSLPYRVHQILGSKDVLEPDVATVRQGMGTFDDFRFLRLRQEIPAKGIHQNGWEPLAKGGAFSFYYSDIHLLVDWRNDGAELSAVNIAHNGQDAQVRQASEYWRRPGLTYSKRSQKGFSSRVLPRGCIIAGKGPAILSQSDVSASYLLGWVNSRFIRWVIEIQANDHEYNTGIVKDIPWIQPHRDTSDLERKTTDSVRIFQKSKSAEETNSCFVTVIEPKQIKEITEKLIKLEQEAERDLKCIMAEWDKFVDELYGVNSKEFHLTELCEDAPENIDEDDEGLSAYITEVEVAKRLLGIFLGFAFGRWDIRFDTGERKPPELPDPFDSLPVCPPGMLQGPKGLPAKPEDVPSDYPIQIDWDGILVDDPEHEDDIVRRVRDVLEVIWKDRAEAIEKEACEILGVRELRDYFRKPGNGGFWMDHVKRYSKSRRKAPIYWYLRSAKGNYGLWLYYHRLDKDILFKALLNYVEPKIRLEEDRLNTLRARKEETGTSGRAAKQLERDLDRQEQFISELHDFKDKLRRAADLHLVPDLNDGVVLNIAPLWELVPWKEAEKYWEELSEGKYEWSSVGKQLREKVLAK